ncbi:uncharacterized protein LOC116342219 [Contarinia nasturtii]|uniref:uncharacterized protein LOC116342219 n=1 Tax=Contarinia nasturtii TaxID=265458 RepID=UPI0012D4A846|nr:uncharacterized protein LOC116342219 [Contarinia nasturtii]
MLPNQFNARQDDNHKEITQYKQILIGTEKTMPRPRIFLNDSPLHLTLNKTLLSSTKNSLARTHISLPVSPAHSEPNESAYFPQRDILRKSNEIESDINMKEICSDLRAISMCPPKSIRSASINSLPDTNSSAYFSGQVSSSYNRNDESGHSFSLSNESSAYFSDQVGDESYKGDSLDVYHYRQPNSPAVASMPSIPKITGKLSARGLVWSPFLADQPQQHDLDKSFIKSPIVNNGPVTSSPFHNHIDHTDIDWDNIEEPDDLNDTLERVEWRLKMCGYKSPPPEKMAKKRQLIHAYVSELLRNEAENESPPFTPYRMGPCSPLMEEVEDRLAEIGCNGQETPYIVSKRKQIMRELASKSIQSAAGPIRPENIQEEDEAFCSLENANENNVSEDMSIVPTSPFNRSIRHYMDDVPNYSLLKEVEDRMIALGCDGEETPYIISKRKQLMRELATRHNQNANDQVAAHSAHTHHVINRPPKSIRRTISIDQDF